MLNKKVLVAAIAASFTTSALAAVTGIDLNDTNAAGEVANTVVVANESFSSSDLSSTGTLTVANASNALDLVTNAGFTIVAGTTKYVRVDVINGAFGGNVSLTGTNVSKSINSQGGTAGDNFVVVEVEADSTTPIAVDDRLTISTSGYIATPGTTVTLKYSLYETGAGAVNELEADLLYSDQEAAIAFADATAGNFVKANTLTATVASGFTQYSTGANGLLATVNTASLIKEGDFIKPDGSGFEANDLLTPATQDITFTGDFSFGTWSFASGTACGTSVTGFAVASDKASATAEVDLSSTNTYALCNELTAGEDVAKKGTYAAELEDGYADDAGAIEFDTLSIEVPYITTFADYNQRIYVVNNGSSEAFYTMTFTSEDGTTATPKAAATGTVPAGEMVMLKATDIVELTGDTTRTSAVIEIEAEDQNISATMQTVNTRYGNGSTDTVVLN